MNPAFEIELSTRPVEPNGALNLARGALRRSWS